MESKVNWNLQDMPQLVIVKVMTFLNHKQLLMLEQVSKKFKCEVEGYFRTTHHLIFGSLPSIEKLNENKKLLQLIQRCGIRLRTIQFNNTQFIDEVWDNRLLDLYINHLFESGGEVISKTCPNIEHIITSPNMDTMSIFSDGQVVALSLAESYANHLHKMGDKCKLRAIRIKIREYNKDITEKKFKALVDCYQNIQHIILNHWNDEQFLTYLPQLIKNGLKDLRIDRYLIGFQDAVEYCKFGIYLQTLRLSVSFERFDDIVSINHLKLPKGLELEIVETKTSSIALLIQNVCDCVVKMVCRDGDNSDCSSMIKLKNLREFKGGSLLHAKLIAKESFPKLKQVDSCAGCHLCRKSFTRDYRNSECMSIFLPELLTSKGHQLTVIRMRVCRSLDLVVKAVKYCKAAVSVHLISSITLDHCTTSITIEDFMAILQLPRLQMFNITDRSSSNIDDLKQKMKMAENGQIHFKFEYDEMVDINQRSYTFQRIDIYEQ